MFNRLQDYFLKWQMKRLMKLLITVATKAIYSEQFNIDAVIRRLADNNKPFQLLRAYIAIQVAMQLTEPMNQKDINFAITTLCRAEQSEQFLNKTDFEKVLWLHKELAELCWLHKTKCILERKLAYKNNNYSYDAAIYKLENVKKCPSNHQEREKWRKLAAAVEESEKQLEDYLEKKQDVQNITPHQEREKSREHRTEGEETAKQEEDYPEFIKVKTSLENQLDCLYEKASETALDKKIQKLIIDKDKTKSL